MSETEEQLSRQSLSGLPESRRKDSRVNGLSRIVSICKNDMGLKNTNTFATFVKATIACNYGDFAFPVLKGVTQSDDLLYTVFSTKRQTFHKSALCIYRTAEIEQNITDSGKIEKLVRIHTNRISVLMIYYEGAAS